MGKRNVSKPDSHRAKLDRRRISRHWAILLYLMKHQFGVRPQKIWEHVGAGRSTVYRDLSDLEAAGVPIAREVRGGEARYFLEASKLPALLLSMLEVLALEVSRYLLEPLEGTSLLDAYDAILARLGRKVHGAPDTPARLRARAVRRIVDDALHSRRHLRMVFIRIGDAEPHERVVEPMSWRLVRGELYLRARDAATGLWRSFSTLRILDVEPIGERLDTPAEEPLFAIDDDLGTLPLIPVVVRFNAVGAAHLHERNLPADAEVVRLSDGGAEARWNIAGIIVAADRIQSWGPNAWATSPPELVAMLQERAMLMLANYANRSSQTGGTAPGDPPPEPKRRRPWLVRRVRSRSRPLPSAPSIS